jgi:hypothetical protein
MKKKNSKKSLNKNLFKELLIEKKKSQEKIINIQTQL